MGNGDAAQIQVVSFFALGASAGLARGRESSQHGDQALPHSGRDLFPHCNLVGRCNIDGISPNAAVIGEVHRFQSDLQLIPFREVVPVMMEVTPISRPACCKSRLGPLYLLVVAKGRMENDGT